MLQAPIDVYVGEPVGGSVGLVLALQARWALALYAAGQLVLSARDAEAGGPGWLSCARWRRSTGA